MEGVEVASAPVHPTPGLAAPDEDLSRLDLFYSLLGISAVVRGNVRRETLAYAAAVFEEMLASLSPLIPEEAGSMINPPLLDALEAADCLGPEALREVFEWAVYTLHGVPREADIGLVEDYAECMGWEMGPIGVDEKIVAGAIILSLTGSFHKYLSRAW